MVSGSQKTGVGISICAFIYALICVSLSAQSLSYGDTNLEEFGLVIIVVTTIWLLSIWLVNQDAQPSKGWIISCSVLFQLCLLPAYPVLENDILRYMWDGYVFVETGNPYAVLPADFFQRDDVPANMQQVLNLVSYPFTPTVYGPVAESLFALSYLILPGSVLPIKFFSFIAVVSLTLLLAKKVSVQQLLLFCWSPLVLFQFSLNGHIDILAVLLVFAALTYSNVGKWWLSPVFLSLAVMTKIVAILALPFVLILKRQYITTLIILAVVYVPLLLSGKHELLGLKAMAEFWMFNSFFYSLWLIWFDNLWIKIISLIIFMGVYFSVVSSKKFFMTFENRCTGLFIVYSVFLLGLSVLNAWYLIWILCFALFTNTRWPWVLACTIWLSLLTGLNLNYPNLGLYEIPLPVIILEYSAVVIICLLMGYFQRWTIKGKAAFSV